jgi:hypothetical protein
LREFLSIRVDKKSSTLDKKRQVGQVIGSIKLEFRFDDSQRIFGSRAQVFALELVIHKGILLIILRA